MPLRSTPDATDIAMGATDPGAMVTVRAPGSIASTLPFVAKLPPAGTTFVVVGLACATAVRGASGTVMATRATSDVAATRRDDLTKLTIVHLSSLQPSGREAAVPTG